MVLGGTPFHGGAVLMILGGTRSLARAVSGCSWRVAMDGACLRWVLLHLSASLLSQGTAWGQGRRMLSYLVFGSPLAYTRGEVKTPAKSLSAIVLRGRLSP